MKVAVPLAKHILTPLGITATASSVDAGIQKKRTCNNNFNNFNWRNAWHNENCQALKDSNILLEVVTKTI